jgi:hypothetical protein
MAYTINLFNGAELTSVADGTIDTAASDITLVGKNFTGYGEILNENFVHMLENFANSTQPTAPLTGQIWWNSALGTLTVYDGTQFKAVSSSTVSASEPAGAVEGDLWWDSDDEQLFVYNGTVWVLVGPSASASAGLTGAIVETITDSGATDHIVVTNYVEGARISITSGDAQFTPQTPITGFTTIDPGVNLIETGTLANARFTGTSTNADLLDNLNSTDFIRATADDVATGIINFQNDTGITIGVDDDLQIGITTINAEIYNRTVGGNLLLGATNAGSAEITAFDFDPDSTLLDFNANVLQNIGTPTAGNHATTKTYVDTIVNDGGGGPVFRDGTNTITGVILPQGNGVLDFGASGSQFKDIYAQQFIGTATQANYADVAERFEADAFLQAGTVVMLGGAKEICEAQEELTEEVFGVVSSKPAHLMNANAGTNETHPPIAMSGRVPVRVVGEVKKGDRLVSAGNGLARAASKDELTSWNVIGRSLEDKLTADEGVVEAIVRINS